jgi:Zn-dependent peptidase ImmA (M78 family)
MLASPPAVGAPLDRRVRPHFWGLASTTRSVISAHLIAWYTIGSAVRQALPVAASLGETTVDKFAIEHEARRLQFEIYSRRDLRHQFGVPDIPALFDPRNVADHCGLFYETRARVIADWEGGGEAAGVWQRDHVTVLVSTRFSYEIQRFTAGHEIGHYILHPHVGDRTLHRELPVEGPRSNRPPLEREADYFSACLLMPRKAVVTEFNARFGAKHPLVLTDTVAYHLKADERALFAQQSGSLMFAETVAKAQQFDRRRFKPMANYFGVSPRAMAIRLDELQLVAPYLYA